MRPVHELAPKAETATKNCDPGAADRYAARQRCRIEDKANPKNARCGGAFLDIRGDKVEKGALDTFAVADGQLLDRLKALPGTYLKTMKVPASDAELVACMRFMAERMKLVVEPTGCLGFAAARRMKDALRGKRVGILVSGGNVDLGRFSSLLGG